MANENKPMTAEELKLSAVSHALAGGRTYGAEQHRLAFETLANHLIDGETTAEAFAKACGDIGNLSQLQQALEKADKIDRNSRSAAKASIWDKLSA